MNHKDIESYISSFPNCFHFNAIFFDMNQVQNHRQEYCTFFIETMGDFPLSFEKPYTMYRTALMLSQNHIEISYLI